MRNATLFMNTPPCRLTGMVGLFVLCISLQACGGAKSATISMEQLEAMSTERYESTGGCEANADGSMILCQSAFLVKEMQPGIKFFVYSKADNQIVYEQTDTCESVQWHDNAHLQITTLSGTVQRNSTGSGNTKLIEVKTGYQKSGT